jgi:hypothetical protein
MRAEDGGGGPGPRAANLPKDRHQQDQACSDSSGEDVRGVYARGACLYRAAGWRGVLPLPPKAKYPPPVGFTGHDGAWPTDEQIDEWSARKADGNLSLRVDYGFMGIDTDAYPPKTGGQTLAEAERRWVPLPATYRSTARIEDEVSGIRVFRVPVGTLLKGVIKFAELGVGDIEIIQPHHRFIVAWPSINPKTAQTYRWFAPDGTLLPEGQVPGIEDIPELPEEWVSALSRDAVREEVFDGSAPNRSRAQRERVNEDLYQKLIGLQGNVTPEKVVAARLEKAISELTNGSGSRYDTTRDHVAALMRFHAQGRAGVPRALRELYAAYVMEVTDTRPQLVAESEFLRFTEGAALLVAASMPNPQAAGEGDGPPQPSRSGRLVRMFPMSGVADDVPEWAWEYGGKGRIQRGTLTLFGGRPGAGKSTSLRWLATQFSLGLAEGCWYGKPQNVAYIAAAEESLRYIVKPGLRAAGADMGRIFFPEVESDGKEVRLSALADEEALTGQLLENGITVVLVDPVMSTIGGQVDIHRNNETREHLEPWARVADRINGVVNGVAHLTKGNNRDVVAAINGSSAFGEVPRAVFGFAKDPKSEQEHRVMSQAKNSAGHEDLSLAYVIESVTVTTDSGKSAEVGKFVIAGDSERTVNDILSEPTHQRGSARDECKAWLRGYMSGRGKMHSALVKAAGQPLGYSRSTIKRASSELEVVIEEEGFPRQTYWTLPGEPNETTVGPREKAEPTEPTGAADDRKASHGGGSSRASTTTSNNNNSGLTDSQSAQLAHENLLADCEPIDATGEKSGSPQQPTNHGWQEKDSAAADATDESSTAVDSPSSKLSCAAAGAVNTNGSPGKPTAHARRQRDYPASKRRKSRRR